jgi:hypothetical protein
MYGAAIIGDSSTEIYQVLQKHNIQIELLKKIIINDKQIPKYFTSLITSQLDCDRLDYLLRDSYFTGVPYGNVDID